MHNSRTENSIKNIKFGFAYQILTLVLTFVNRTVFLQCLSIDYLGISGLFSDILNMISLADLGFNTAMNYSMYELLARKDYRKLAALTGFYKKIYRIIAISITLIGLCLVPFLQYLVKLNSDLPYLKLYYVLYLANTVASYLVIYKTCILIADQKGYITTKYLSIFSIIRTICMIIFLYLTKSYTIYLCIQVVFTYLNNFYISHVAEKMYPFIKQKEKLSKQEGNDILNNIKAVFLYKISGVMLNATDNTLISIIVSTTMVGYYSNYTMVISKITNLINTLFYSLTSSLGNLIVKEGKERRYQIFTIMQSVSVILTTVCISCVFFLEEDLIRVWLGSEYILDKQVLYAVSVNFYFSIALLPIWVFREATGLYRKTKYIMLLTALINIVLSITMGIWLGLPGIIYASAISRLVTYFWIEPRLLFQAYFGHSCIVYFLGVLKSIIVTGVVFAVEYLLLAHFKPNNWTFLIFKALAVGIVCLAIVFVIYRKNEGFKLLIDKVKKMISR